MLRRTAALKPRPMKDHHSHSSAPGSDTSICKLATSSTTATCHSLSLLICSTSSTAHSPRMLTTPMPSTCTKAHRCKTAATGHLLQLLCILQGMLQSIPAENMRLTVFADLQNLQNSPKPQDADHANAQHLQEPVQVLLASRIHPHQSPPRTAALVYLNTAAASSARHAAVLHC